jgi:hypothetical protein
VEGETPTRGRWPRRLTKEQEQQILKALPKLQRLILISKVSAVVFFAIGLEGLVTFNWPLAGIFLSIGVALAIWPVRMNVNLCPRCGTHLPRSAAICNRCGVAVL